MLKTKSIRTARRRRRFLAMLEETALVAEACRAAGAARGSFYRWRYEDPAFAADWDAALALGIATLEDEAIRRARDGVECPVFYGGDQIATVRKVSDTLLMFLLRAHRPALYREQPAWRRDGRYGPYHGGAGDRRYDADDQEKLSPEARDRRIVEILAQCGMKIVPLEEGEIVDLETLAKLPLPPP